MNFVQIRYVGRKPYRDRFMGLEWTPDQAQHVTPQAAQQLLKFVEFVPATGGKKAKAEAKDAEADSVQHAQAVLQKQETDQERRDEAVLEVLIQVDDMDKDALEQLALRYEVNLDKRRSVQALRQQVGALVEQFGVL